MMFDQHCFCRYVLTHCKLLTTRLWHKQQFLKERWEKVAIHQPCWTVKKYLRGTSTMVLDKNLTKKNYLKNYQSVSILYFIQNIPVWSHRTTFQNGPLALPVYFKAGEISSHWFNCVKTITCGLKSIELCISFLGLIV